MTADPTRSVAPHRPGARFAGRWGAALALGLVLAGPAAAEPPGPEADRLTQPVPPADEARAKALYATGRSLYEAGRYEEAIVAWEQAYQLSNRPNLQFNLANAHERLGDLGQALDALYAYQRFAPADEHEALEGRIRAIEARMDAARSPAPAVLARANPPGPAPLAPARSRRSPAAGAALLGVGVTVAGAGLALGAVGSRAQVRTLQRCAAVAEGLGCPPGLGDELARHRRTTALGGLGLGVGALSAGLGLGLLAVGGERASLDLGIGRLGLSGRW